MREGHEDEYADVCETFNAVMRSATKKAEEVVNNFVLRTGLNSIK